MPNFQSRLVLTLLVSSLIITSAPSSHATSKPIDGKACKTVGAIKLLRDHTFVCSKNGKRSIWKIKDFKPNQRTIILKPTGLSNLVANRKGISSAAWEKSSEIMRNNSPKFGSLEIYTGPNTEPYFDDYPKAIGLVSRLFPDRAEPEKTLVIRYKYRDLDWAETIFQEKIGADSYQQMNSTENGQLVPANCSAQSKECPNSMQQTSAKGVNVILQGFRNTDTPNDATGKLRFYSGMLEAHEYFHSMQRIPIMGKPGVTWPQAWFREGGAEWVQTMAIYYQDFTTYKEYLRLDCAYECQKLSESDIQEFLTLAKENYLPPKFHPWLNYSLGAHVIEALVALKNPDVLIEMYSQMSTGNSFEQSFKNIFGEDWSYAVPILSKAIYLNLKGQ